MGNIFSLSLTDDEQVPPSSLGERSGSSMRSFKSAKTSSSRLSAPDQSKSSTSTVDSHTRTSLGQRLSSRLSFSKRRRRPSTLPSPVPDQTSNQSNYNMTKHMENKLSLPPTPNQTTDISTGVHSPEDESESERRLRGDLSSLGIFSVESNSTTSNCNYLNYENASIDPKGDNNLIMTDNEEKKKLAALLYGNINKRHMRSKSDLQRQHRMILNSPSPSVENNSFMGLVDANKNLERSSSAPQMVSTNEMEGIIRDAIGYQLFKDFCVSEYSAENVNLWKELNDMEKNFIDMTEKRRSKVINMVYDKYIDESSSEEVNIRGKTKKLIDGERKSEKIDLDRGNLLIHELKKDLFVNLIDSFSRFIKTEDYRLWKEMRDNPHNVFE